MQGIIDLKLAVDSLALVSAGIGIGLFVSATTKLVRKVDNHGKILQMLGRDLHLLYKYMVTGDRKVLEEGYHLQLEDRRREAAKRGVSIYDLD